MIVCFCNGLRDADVRGAARLGHQDVESCYAALGGSVQCGQCVCYAREVIEAAITPATGGALLAAE